MNCQKVHIKNAQLRDLTTLILIDKATRLRIVNLEQARTIFNARVIGVILIGVPGLDKLLACGLQLYPHIGFVHELRPLSAPRSASQKALRDRINSGI